jgi:phage tail sheath gpL-like
MAVAFNQIPTNIRVPLFYAEVNAGPNYNAGNSKLLVIGQKLSGGAAPADVPAIVADDIEAKYGAGSMLVDMIRTARRNNPFGEIWALPLADPSGAAAVWTVTIAGTLTPGFAVLYIAGERVVVSVTAADTVTTVAAAFVARINAGYTDTDGRNVLHPVSAANTAGVITLTSRHVGLVGNSIGIEKDYVGDEGPNAALMTIAATTPGSGTPTLTAGLAACGSTEFDMIAFPYADATSLNSMRDFLSDRWGPMSQLYGGAFTASAGNLSAQTTLGASRNDPNVFIMPFNGAPTPTWVWAASIGANVQAKKNLGAALSEAIEISRPMHGLILRGVKPPKELVRRWSTTDRQTLYFTGMSGYTVTPDGQVAIDRLISTYRLNASGVADTTWLDVETRYQTVYVLRQMRHAVATDFARVALARSNPGNIQGLATPDDIKARIILTYGALVAAGIAKEKQIFADNLIVEISSDPNRVNAYLPLMVVNQLRIFAANITTFLDATNV